MKLVVLDFETYFDPSVGYSMGGKGGMEAEEYIRDSRFECLGLAVAVGNAEPGWVPGPRVGEFLSRVPWHEVLAVAHNASFDGLILHHHYGHSPAKWLCTRAMARAALAPAAGPDGKRVSYSLGPLCAHFGLGEKGEIPHAGMRYESLANHLPEVLSALAEYAKRDVSLTRKLFAVLASRWPAGETEVLDRVTRMTTEPVLRVGIGADVPDDADAPRVKALQRVAERGAVPACIEYHGQSTGKFSGGGGYNLPGAHVGGSARLVLRGVTGHLLVAADMRSIEMRILFALAGEWGALEAIRDGRDLYAEFAREVFELPPGAELTPDQLKVGKEAVLACGFGVGAKTLASRMGGGGAMAGAAATAVARYKERFKGVVRYWRAGRRALEALANGSSDLAAWGPLTLEREAPEPFPHPAFVLPSGRRLIYPGLRVGGGGRVRYDRFGREELLYPGKLTANVVSALARDVVCEWMVRVCRRASYAKLALVVIDELVFSCPSDRVEDLSHLLADEATRLPDWADPRLALEAKVAVGETWGDLK